MNTPNQENNDLNLDPEKAQASSQEITIENILLNILSTLSGISMGIEAVSVELQDLKDNDNRRLLNEKLITEMEIEERENAGDEED